MSIVRKIVPSLIAFGLVLAACNGTTGDQLISFTPYASGVPDATKPFTAYYLNSAGQRVAYSIQLTSATMNIGAVYFDESPPASSFDAPVCNTADIYAAQVPGGAQVNLLSSEPQEFTVFGNGSADVALSWDLWLTSGDINQPTSTPTATLTGIATLASDPTQVFTFGAVVTINPNESGAGARGMAASDPALPGAYPICKERILQIGGINLGFYQGGKLLVTVDPRGWFAETTSIDFSSLAPYSDEVCQPTEDDWQDAYESRGPCDATGACPSGQVCNKFTADAVPICVEPCTGGACSNGFVCNPTDGNCIAAYCIPDTNQATVCTGTDTPATDPCTNANAAEAGQALFLGITEATNSYEVTFTGSGS